MRLPARWATVAAQTAALSPSAIVAAASRLERRMQADCVMIRRVMDPSAGSEEGFYLYDLRIEVVGPADRQIFCGAKPGDYFELHGEMLKLPPGQGFSIFSLGALLPLLAAKQRVTDPNDWMTTDAEIACPDPNCPTRFRITRTGRRFFRRSDVTAVKR
jgi:uncharacterized repeat protein (TIGR04076 family)